MLQVQDKVILSNREKVVDLTARSMANNIVISGLCGDQIGQDGEKENCKEKVLLFLRNVMKMEVEDNEVVIAHRSGGIPKNNKPRAMIVRCAMSLRERIFKFTRNLKDITNDIGEQYYVNVQLPEPLATEKRECENRLRSIKKANSLIPDEQEHQRTAVHIKNNMLYINKVPQKKHVLPPTVQEMFNCDKETKAKMEKITFAHTSSIIDKKSIFNGHAATRKPVGFMQSCCFVFVGIVSTYKYVLLILGY